MIKRLLGLKRSAYILIAAAISIAGLMPFLSSTAFAYVQLEPRSIEMSSSAVGNTGTSYLVTFTPPDAAKNVRIDFCSTSPIYTDTCTAPTGMNASSATFTNGSGFSGWAIATGNNTAAVANTGANFVTINDASAYATGSSINFTLGGITNPTTLGTFYARIYTYNATSNDYASAASPGTVVDFGGIALSTANVISITAKVQETLTFCVEGATFGPTTTNLTCSTNTATPPTLTLGHGSPQVLTPSATDEADAFTQVSTNASSGVSMRMQSGNSCANGGLSNVVGGATCNIPGLAGGTSSSVSLPAGTAGFGLFVAASSNNTGGTGTITPATTYNGATHVTIPGDLYYGMNGANVSSAYGDVIASSAGPTSLTSNELVFGGTASLTTQAGIYTANENIITTGTF